MQFGNKKTVVALDDNGSTKTIDMNIRDGQVTGNIREFFEIRHKVGNDLEEYAQFNSFYKEYTTDPTMLDPMFRVEGRNNKDGKRFTVNCFTRVIR